MKILRLFINWWNNQNGLLKSDYHGRIDQIGLFSQCFDTFHGVRWLYPVGTWHNNHEKMICTERDIYSNKHQSSLLLTQPGHWAIVTAQSSALSPVRSRLGCLQTSWSSMMGRLRPYHVDQGHCSCKCRCSLSVLERVRSHSPAPSETSYWFLTQASLCMITSVQQSGAAISPQLSCISCNLAWQWKQQIALLRHLCLQDWMTATAFYVTPQLKNYTGFSLSKTTQQEQWLAQKGQTTLNFFWKDFIGCL